MIPCLSHQELVATKTGQAQAISYPLFRGRSPQEGSMSSQPLPASEVSRSLSSKASGALMLTSPRRKLKAWPRKGERRRVPLVWGAGDLAAFCFVCYIYIYIYINFLLVERKSPGNPKSQSPKIRPNSSRVWFGEAKRIWLFRETGENTGGVSDVLRGFKGKRRFCLGFLCYPFVWADRPHSFKLEKTHGCVLFSAFG